ncbi:NUMOD4 motif-containing HNH endonuclease [Priestia megaterium]|uniref:NUMOD4 motif-containing HNH endonuclease n=1 Tax=Priestia megaterium TaxID=1404 RepID=UPI002E22101E|nr:NUMOD4 motif-containing HNH endonuclease [Priestia megaterium]
MNHEIWKPIGGYEEYYEVSNFGRVRSKDRRVSNGPGSYIKKARILKRSKTTTGYWKVELSKDGTKKSLKVHRLVAAAFIDNPNNKPFVNHIDGNPLNNHISNLEWCTQAENMQHAYQTGLIKCNFHKYKQEIVEEYTEDPDATIKKLSKKYGCNESSIRNFFKTTGVRIKTISEVQTKYKIDRKSLVEDFETGLSNKEIAKKFKTNSGLIAAYRYKHKKGELLI